MMTVNEWWGMTRADRLAALEQIRVRGRSGVDADYLQAVQTHPWLLDKFIQGANFQRLRKSDETINAGKVLAEVLSEPFIHRHIGTSQMQRNDFDKSRNASEMAKLVATLFPIEFNGMFRSRGMSRGAA